MTGMLDVNKKTELWQTLATTVNNTANSHTLSMERQLL